MFIERRRQPRRNGFKTGSLLRHDDPQPTDCLVWDLSDFGALIEVEKSADVPANFRLVATTLFLDRECKTIWRDGRKIGVAFVF
jgi:hypothetical protein